MKERSPKVTHKKLAPPCGIYCGDCEHLGDDCRGCGYVAGKPFWTSAMNLQACPIYDCCINYNHLEHCGLCEELPCKSFLELRDPALSEAEFQESLHNRQKELGQRREIGTDKWLEERVQT